MSKLRRLPTSWKGVFTLINLPVINNVFSKIAVDIVGPLTHCAVSGNRFDFASHFPLAHPIKVHTAAEVVKCLILVFTTFGFIIIISIIIIITIVLYSAPSRLLLRSAPSPASVKHNGLQGKEEGDGYLAESYRKPIPGRRA